MEKFYFDLIHKRKQGVQYNILRSILYALSLVFAWITKLRFLVYEKGVLKGHRFKLPVISIGNLSMGGTGKTPCVTALVSYLVSKSKKGAVLTRGYMRNTRYQSDEAQLLKERFSSKDLSVLIGADRVQNGIDFLKKNSTHYFLLDDGFQHFQIERDLDIVLISLNQDWQNYFCLPRGVYREPKEALQRAHVCLLTHTKHIANDEIKLIEQEVKTINSNIDVLRGNHEPTQWVDLFTQKNHDLNSFHGFQAIAVSAIGDPNGFLQLLKQNHLEITDSIEFNDHHVYTDRDIDQILQTALKLKEVIVVTTHKDAVKLYKFKEYFENKNIKILYLEINLVIENQQLLQDKLDALL